MIYVVAGNYQDAVFFCGSRGFSPQRPDVSVITGLNWTRLHGEMFREPDPVYVLSSAPMWLVDEVVMRARFTNFKLGDKKDHERESA